MHIRALGHLQTREVGDVLEPTVRRIEKYLRRRKIAYAQASDEELRSFIDAIERLEAIAQAIERDGRK
jgi:hypothetical protein